jgi:hypothetical protein
VTISTSRQLAAPDLPDVIRVWIKLIKEEKAEVIEIARTRQVHLVSDLQHSVRHKYAEVFLLIPCEDIIVRDRCGTILEHGELVHYMYKNGEYVCGHNEMLPLLIQRPNKPKPAELPQPRQITACLKVAGYMDGLTLLKNAVCGKPCSVQGTVC